MKTPERLLMTLNPPPGHRPAFSRRGFVLFGKFYVWHKATPTSIAAGALCVLGMVGLCIGMIQLFISLIAVAAVLFLPIVTLVVSSLLIKASFMITDGKLKIGGRRRG